ncbi:hypothetical protein CRUP_003768, partial [Coryphaenoides rupestris]
MSTDDSVSEDVSSTSGALSHCHASGADGDGDGGKESEVSCVSSEGTSASCRAGLEERRARPPTAPAEGGAVGSRPMDMTPACDKIRSLCLSTEEAFDQGRILPFINPSSLETLRALVQEIHNSGETDPEMWKDCEGRWLHLFQLVEKQYQEQILAQQEQYQCQIQLIQDEIKALVQLQNRQLSPTSATNTTITASTTGPATTTATTTSTKDLDLTFTSSLRPAPPAHHPPHSEADHPDTAPSSPPPSLLHLRRSEEKVPAVAGPAQERPTTMLSSGYGTLSTWETGPQQTGGGPGNEEEEEEEEEVVVGEEGGSGCGGNQQQEEREEEELGWSDSLPGDDAERAVIVCHRRLSSDGKTGSTSQPLTSWAQRQKLRPRKGKRGRTSSQGQEPWEPVESPRDTPKDHLPEHIGLQDQFQCQPASMSTSFFPLRRSHSLVSEASGLTYWRLNECDLYHPLPDSLDSGAFLFLQEDTSVTPPPETQLSLKEIYQSKRKTALRCTDWDGSQSSGPLSPQAGGSSDPGALTRQSDRTSGFTSPSHFSSPSYPNQSLPACPRGPGTPATPDSAADLGNLEPSRSSTSGSL